MRLHTGYFICNRFACHFSELITPTTTQFFSMMRPIILKLSETRQSDGPAPPDSKKPEDATPTLHNA